MSDPKWPEAKRCFNCGTEESVWRDIGLCNECEASLIVHERLVEERFVTSAKPHWDALKELERDRDQAIENQLDEYNIPEDFRKSKPYGRV